MFSFFERKLMRTVSYSHIERIPFKILKSLGFFVCLFLVFPNSELD